MISHAIKKDLEFRPLCLVINLQPGKYPGCTTGGGGHQIMVFRQAGCNTIVHNHTVFTAHKTVTTSTRSQFRPGIGIDPAQKLTSIFALDINLAQR